MKTYLSITILALSCLSAQAGKPASSAPAKQSTFTMDAGDRNPFWPIGWKPVARASTNDHSGPQIQPSAFVVSSITYDNGGRFAIINGKSMTAGQQFGLQIGSQTYQLTVKAIEDGQVILARRDEEIIVPLRRK